jgi:hypothetical protein
MNIKRIIINRAVAGADAQAGKASIFFYKTSIPKSAAQSAKAKISSQTVFPAISFYVKGGIYEQNRLNWRQFFIPKIASARQTAARAFRVIR